MARYYNNKDFVKEVRKHAAAFHDAGGWDQLDAWTDQDILEARGTTRSWIDGIKNIHRILWGLRSLREDLTPPANQASRSEAHESAVEETVEAVDTVVSWNELKELARKAS